MIQLSRDLATAEGRHGNNHVLIVFALEPDKPGLMAKNDSEPGSKLNIYGFDITRRFLMFYGFSL